MTQYHSSINHNHKYTGLERRQGNTDRRRPDVKKKPNYALRRTIVAAGLVALGAGVHDAYGQLTDTRTVVVPRTVAPEFRGSLVWKERSDLAEQFRMQGATVLDLQQIESPEPGQAPVAYKMEDVHDGYLGDTLDAVFQEAPKPIDQATLDEITAQQIHKGTPQSGNHDRTAQS